MSFFIVMQTKTVNKFKTSVILQTKTIDPLTSHNLKTQTKTRGKL